MATEKKEEKDREELILDGRKVTVIFRLDGESLEKRLLDYFSSGTSKDSSK